ncbi:MAG TPA: hypothetical protein VKX46_09125 [Ktedonobacteraceae bacterium]|nr:hypothetical protein [Ktedonobacteraceae bacterium]
MGDSRYHPFNARLTSSADRVYNTVVKAQQSRAFMEARQTSSIDLQRDTQ